MRTLDVHLEGVGLVGKLTSDDLMSLSFRYDDAYRGPPLSIALPITIQSYGDVDSRTFFHGLLQEGWQLDDVAAKNRIDRADTVGLLTLLGQECAGAVSVVQEGDPPGKDPGDLTTDYVEIPPEQFALDIANLHARRSPAPPDSIFAGWRPEQDGCGGDRGRQIS